MMCVAQSVTLSGNGLRVTYERSRAPICNKTLHIAREIRIFLSRLSTDHRCQRLSKSALVITLTELSAIAAPATTGLR